MADSRRLYLKLQAELGGAEVYRTTREPVRTPADAAVAEATSPGDARAAGPSRPRPDWRRNLPEIPGPGLVVESAPPGLLEATPAPESLDEIARVVAACRKCPLGDGRTNVVPGEGNPAARLMCVGEGPGETEDRTGRPFVGRAGELLNDILTAIELSRDAVFIANVVKCRPPQNRKPLPDEMNACLPFLRRQIQLIRPRVLLALGATAAEGLLGVRKNLGELRGRVHRFDGIPLIVTYHPAALLRNPNWKKPTWDDVRIARQLLDD